MRLFWKYRDVTEEKGRPFSSVLCAIMIVLATALLGGCADAGKAVQREAGAAEPVGDAAARTEISGEISAADSDSAGDVPGEAAASGTGFLGDAEEIASAALEIRVPEAVEETPRPTEEPYISPYQDFFDTWPECVAWLRIEGTVIDYPVMWREGDNEHYLSYDYTDCPARNGSLMMDEESRVSPMTTNVMIHGHHTKNGTMFGMLEDYYAQEKDGMKHREIWLYTRDGEYCFELMSAFYTQIFDEFDTVFKYYFFYQAETEEELRYYCDNVKALEQYDTGVEAKFGDYLITLSTCSYQVRDGRFVVVGRYAADREDAGEQNAADADGATEGAVE